MQLDRPSAMARQHANTVAALVVVIGRMQWLMHVPHEVKQELERKKSLSRRGTGITQLLFEFPDFLGHAALSRHIACGRTRWRGRVRTCRGGVTSAGTLDLNVDEVPLACRVLRFRTMFAKGV